MDLSLFWVMRSEPRKVESEGDVSSKRYPTKALPDVVSVSKTPSGSKSKTPSLLKQFTPPVYDPRGLPQPPESLGRVAARDMVTIEEGAAFVVPVGSYLVVRALGSNGDFTGGPSFTDVQLLVGGQVQIAAQGRLQFSAGSAGYRRGIGLQQRV